MTGTRYIEAILSVRRGVCALVKTFSLDFHGNVGYTLFYSETITQLRDT